ncbi:hypothetical protein I6F07_17315 [Ensifer sp. IC4062]|nr:hypothetical protein [Ensifer sp. IC4062]MCA1441941.1 hypothetical protein [Ensifer sp. IC4062]
MEKVFNILQRTLTDIQAAVGLADATLPIVELERKLPQFTARCFVSPEMRDEVAEHLFSFFPFENLIQPTSERIFAAISNAHLFNRLKQLCRRKAAIRFESHINENSNLYAFGKSAVVLEAVDDPQFAYFFGEECSGVLVASIATAPKRYLLRLIRDAMIRIDEDSGWILVHAASAMLSQRGVLVAGDSGAGKTTLLCHLLALGSGYISNDRTLLGKAADWSLRGIPTPARIGKGTALASPALRLLLSEHRDPPKRDWIKSIVQSKAKVELSPREIQSAFGCDVITQATLSLVMLPRIISGDQSRRVNIRTLRPEEALAGLASSVFTPQDESWRPWMSHRKTWSIELGLHALQMMTTLASEVRVVEVEYAAGALPTDLEGCLKETMNLG